MVTPLLVFDWVHSRFFIVIVLIFLVQKLVGFSKLVSFHAFIWQSWSSITINFSFTSLTILIYINWATSSSINFISESAANKFASNLHKASTDILMIVFNQNFFGQQKFVISCNIFWTHSRISLNLSNFDSKLFHLVFESRSNAFTLENYFDGFKTFNKICMFFINKTIN